MKTQGYILNRKKDSTQIVLQACVPFTSLKQSAQFGYRVNPMEDPYSSSFFGDANNQYQRRVDNKRVNEIKSFIRNSILKEKNSDVVSVLFPTAMLIAFDYDDEIAINEETMTFGFELPEVVYIVDGQHRLWSMIQLYKEVEGLTDDNSQFIKQYLEKFKFNCTLLMNFDMWEQAQVFASVNFKQKAVNKSLYYDIYGMEYHEEEKDREKSAMYVAHQIIKELNSNPKSALHGFIKMLGTGRGYVSQSCLADAMIPSILSEQGIWYVDFELDRNRQLSYNYMIVEAMSFFNAVAETFPKMWPHRAEKSPSILCKTTGSQVLVRLMGYLHKINRRIVYRMIDRESEDIYINTEYQALMKEYLNLFVKRQEELFGLANEGGKFSGTGGKGLVKRLYDELVRIVDEKNFGRYTGWLDGNLDESDYDDVYCLYMSVYNVEKYGLYSARQEGDNIVVECDMGEGKLILRGSVDQQKFLDYLDDTYGEDIGVEAMYNFNRAMEKDD